VEYYFTFVCLNGPLDELAQKSIGGTSSCVRQKANEGPIDVSRNGRALAADRCQRTGTREDQAYLHYIFIQTKWEILIKDLYLLAYMDFE
jgi:hypothetical protein